MTGHKYTLQEIKVTAMIYATRKEVVEQVCATGHLPKVIPLGGFPTAMNVLVCERGRDPELDDEEQLVYDAILRDRSLPGGGVILVPGSLPVYSLEVDQN